MFVEWHEAKTVPSVMRGRHALLQFVDNQVEPGLRQILLNCIEWYERHPERFLHVFQERGQANMAEPLISKAGYLPGHPVYVQRGLTVSEVDDVLLKMTKIEAAPRSLEVKEGEWLVVKGPSGANKSATCAASYVKLASTRGRPHTGCRTESKHAGTLGQPILPPRGTRVVTMGSRKITSEGNPEGTWRQQKFYFCLHSDCVKQATALPLWIKVKHPPNRLPVEAGLMLSDEEIRTCGTLQFEA